jgi:peptidoglycan/LPS O-acetylase OafA/YrhL
MNEQESRWTRVALWVHLFVVALSSWQLAQPHFKLVYALWACISGTSLFVLTGLVHEASHHLLFRSRLINEAAGNLAGWLVLTPLTAYRAFHLKHHQTTNEENDPNRPLNSRWMLGVGALVYVCLVHLYAWRNLRGRVFVRYLVELVGMTAFLAALVYLPRALRERAWLLPLFVVAALQNIRIVSEHLDLGPGRYHDTWQLVLPRWLSRWVLYYDHHLEHHLRPGLRWHELPTYRANLVSRDPGLGLLRLGLFAYFCDVFLKPAGAFERRTGRTTSDGSEGSQERDFRAPSRLRFRADRPEPSPSDSVRAEARYHGLDALRGITMVLVVVLHAALAYAVVPIPNLIWVVRDPAAHPVFDLLCWWTLGISSPFYLMSGLFAAELVRSKGLWKFVKNRCKRIIGPFVAAGLIILPFTFFVWVGGWLVSGQCTLREIARMKFHTQGYQQNLYGPAHLWSLEYLAVMLLAYTVVQAISLKTRRPGVRVPLGSATLRRILTSPWRPLLFALPTTLILWAGLRVYGVDAMIDRSNSFLPECYRLLHNSIFFVSGVMLHQLRDDLGRLVHWGWRYLILSVPAFFWRAFLLHHDLIRPLTWPGDFFLALAGAIFAWLITFGMLGLALGVFRQPRPALRYLADSSYWVYLCHLPLVGLLQLDLLPLAIPASFKFAAVLSVTMALCLASYQVMVRHTLLGRWLHGPRAASKREVRVLHPAFLRPAAASSNEI